MGERVKIAPSLDVILAERFDQLSPGLQADLLKYLIYVPEIEAYVSAAEHDRLNARGMLQRFEPV
jgi:hypothetical protein